MKVTATSPLFTDLSTEQAATVQGGCHRHRSYRSTYYYAPRRTYAYYPSYNYGYSGGGSSGYGSNARSNAGSVNQVVNVNVRYED